MEYKASLSQTQERCFPLPTPRNTNPKQHFSLERKFIRRHVSMWPGLYSTSTSVTYYSFILSHTYCNHLDRLSTEASWVKI